MDYSQCFDRIDAETSIAMLDALAFPKGLIAVLKAVWTKQKRYVIWQGHVAKKTLEAGVLPQGDPMSPFVLNVWMKSGGEQVKRALKARKYSDPYEDRFTKTYMDDRSWTDTNEKRLLDAITEWEKFSTDVGLKENKEKTQVAAKNS